MNISSTLVQTEKTVNVDYNGKEYTVTMTTTEGSMNTSFDIVDDEGDLVKEESPVGILISNHIIETYI